MGTTGIVRTTPRGLFLATLLALTGQIATAELATIPVALSPGGLRFEAAVSTCPTFSWTTTPGATGYELAVFLMSDERKAVDEPPLLRLSLPAGASSWTPSADRCLMPGSKLAWVVRSLGEQAPGPWSEAKLFVAPSPAPGGTVSEAPQGRQPSLDTPRDGLAPEPGSAGSSPPGEPAQRQAGARPLAEAVASLAAGPAAIRGERPETNGAAFGLVGVVNTVEGAGLAADNTAGGADLFLAGSPGALVTESRWELDSPTPQTFTFDNPSGDLTLMVKGLEVLTGTITGSEVEDGTLLFADLAQNGCNSGEGPQWSGSAWICAAAGGGGDAETLDGLDSTSFLRSDTSDTYSAGVLTFGSGTTLDTTAGALEVGTMAKSGTAVVTNLNADLLDGQEAASFAPVVHAHFGATWSGDSSSPGLTVVNDGDTAIDGLTSSTANDAGVMGRSDNDGSKGVWGINLSTTGEGTGVMGDSMADQGYGILGLARSGTGTARGVFGQSQAALGVGVEGWATAAGDLNVGVLGRSSSGLGLGGYFRNQGGGLALAAGGTINSPTLTVDQAGNVAATSFTGDGSGLSGVAATDADTVDGFHASDVATADTLLALDGAGKLPASITGDADTVDGLHAAAFAGAVHDHFGESWSGSSASPGLEVVHGGSSGRGVVGWSSSATGINYGVYGRSDSEAGRAVYGTSTATEGASYGVLGETTSSQGFGVRGRATSGAGINFAVVGDTASAGGLGGLFVNTGGGILLAANDTLSASDPKFQVASDGTVTATAFVGGGAGLTNVSASDSDTLDGIDSTSFLRSDASDSYGSGTLTFAGGTILDLGAATLVVGDIVKLGTPMVPNLNADLLDGQHASAFATTAHDHFGQTWSGSVVGSGLRIVNGSSSFGIGLTGEATATSGATVGVIGRTSSADGTAVLGESTIAGAIAVHGQVAAGTGAGIGVRGTTASNAGYGGLFVNEGGSGIALAAGAGGPSPEFRVDAAGGVFAGSVRPRTDNSFSLGGSGARWTSVWSVNGTLQTSDLRLKEEVTDLDYGLEELLALRPVSFRWKDGDGGRNLGFVAQETQRIVPEVVEQGEDPQGLLGMAYGELVPLLVKAIQQQQAEIGRLAARVAELESGKVGN